MKRINIGVEAGKDYKFFQLENYISKDYGVYYFVTPRNVGKSTSMWNKIFNDYLEKGHVSAYLRRYLDDLKYFTKSANLIVNKINKEYNTNFAYRNMAIWDDSNGIVVCAFHALNTMGKTASTINDDTYNIFFDEVQQHGTTGYLPNEYRIFCNMVFHLARHKDFKVFMFGNALTVENPYFTAWGFFEDDVKEFELGRIKAWIFNDTDFKIPQANRTMLDLISYDPKLEKMAIRGEFSYDKKHYILYKKKAYSLILKLDYVIFNTGIYFGVYSMPDDVKWICRLDDCPKGANLITFNFQDELQSKGQKIDNEGVYNKLYMLLKNDKLYFSDGESRDLLIYEISRLKLRLEVKDASRKGY